METDELARRMTIAMGKLNHNEVFTMESAEASGSPISFIEDYVASVVAHPEGSAERLANEAFTVTAGFGSRDFMFKKANYRALSDNYGGVSGVNIDEYGSVVTIVYDSFDDFVNSDHDLIDVMVGLVHDNPLVDDETYGEVEMEVVTEVVDSIRDDLSGNLEYWEDEFRDDNEDEGEDYITTVVGKVFTEVNELVADEEEMHTIVRESDSYMDAVHHSDSIDPTTVDFIWDENVLSPVVDKHS